MRNKWLTRVLGEAEAPPPTEDAIPPNAEPADEEAGGVEDMPSSEVVNALVQAWQSGSRNDVAAQLLFTPVSYADFVRLCYRIGQPDAEQLGDLLDQLAEEEGMVTDVPGENKILARVTGEREAEPSGEQVTDDEAQAQLVPPGQRP